MSTADLPEHPSTASGILARALELHEKASMPWAAAEELALSEAGIDDAAIDELIGEAGYAGLDSLLTDPDSLRQFARSLLVHQPLASRAYGDKRAREAVPEGWKLVPVEPTEEMLAAAHEADREYTLRTFGDVMTVQQGPYDHYKAMLRASPSPDMLEKR